jgi:hypothetical protein
VEGNENHSGAAADQRILHLTISATRRGCPVDATLAAREAFDVPIPVAREFPVEFLIRGGTADDWPWLLDRLQTTFRRYGIEYTAADGATPSDHPRARKLHLGDDGITRLRQRIADAERRLQEARREDERRELLRHSAAHRLEGKPWFAAGDPLRTAINVTNAVARAEQRVPSADEVLRWVNEAGVAHAFGPADWPGHVGHAVAACGASFNKAYEPFRFGGYVDHLRSLVPEDRLRTTSSGRTVRVDYLDLDIALNFYDWCILGRLRHRRTGQIRTGALMDHFRAHKPHTGRGCSKPKENLLDRLATEYRLIDLVNGHYVPKRYSKVYRLGVNHPLYKEVALSVWDTI